MTRHVYDTEDLMAKGKPEEAAPSMMKMVEAALDSLGLESGPSEIGPWVEKTYGKEIGKQMISSYASQIRKKKRGGKSGTLKLPAAGGNAMVGVKDLAVLRDLIDRVGSSEVQTLVKVLSK